MIDKKQRLEKVLHDLETSCGLVATDRPDLPLSDSTSWALDFSESIATLEELIREI